MSVQTRYEFSSPIGIAGGIADISPHAIESRVCAQPKDGAKMYFGMGVVKGEKGGTDVLIPSDTSTAAAFEGVAVNSFIQEYDLDGELYLQDGDTVGVMSWGKIWVRIPEGADPKYGDTAHLIKTGDNAGMFTNVAGAEAFAVRARFISEKGTGNIAMVELFNQKNA